MSFFHYLYLLFLPTLLFGSPSFFILLGAPGSGKGTQAALLAEELHLPHISVGDLLRISIQEESELGMTAKGFMDRGELVPDDLVLKMLAERIKQPDCKEGALLDGTSRKLNQAEFLFNLVKDGSPIAIYFNIPSEALVERIEGRKCCPQCGDIFHSKFYPEAKEGICNRCGSILTKRKDDNSEILKNRLKIFHEQIDLVLDFYQSKNILYAINANQSIEIVHFDITQMIEHHCNKSRYHSLPTKFAIAKTNGAL